MDLIPTSPTETLEERASWLLLQGEVSLSAGDFPRASDLFREVTALCPHSARFLYRQGVSLSEFGSEEALKLACRRFKEALDLEPALVEGWHSLGRALLKLAMSDEHGSNLSYLHATIDTLKKAIELSKDESTSELHWDLALAYHELAAYSKEALDLFLATEAYGNAAATREELPSTFWLGFARASLELGHLVSDLRHTMKAMGFIKLALTQNAHNFDAWALMADASVRIYQLSLIEEHFKQASDYFKAAHDLKPHNAGHLAAWGRFLMESARRSRDPKKARDAIEKFHRAHTLKADDADILGAWGESMALMGDLTERLELIIEGMNRVRRAIEGTADPSLELITSHGFVLLAMGRYFSDYDLAYAAVEKFQEGLSIDRTFAPLWHAIATAYVTVGEIDEDTSALERSLHFFEKAIDLNPFTHLLVDYATALYKFGELSHSEKEIEAAQEIFERILSSHKSAIYLYPEWLFTFACTLHRLAEFQDEESLYTRAIDLLSHVALLDPEFPRIHHRLGLAHHDLGELSGDVDSFFRALHHFRLEARKSEENDQLLLDCAIAMISTAHRMNDQEETELFLREAEHKLGAALQLGNMGALYHLGCLASIRGDYAHALRYLEKARHSGSLPPVEEILEDDWLDGLRLTADFQTFLSKL